MNVITQYTPQEEAAAKRYIEEMKQTVVRLGGNPEQDDCPTNAAELRDRQFRIPLPDTRADDYNKDVRIMRWTGCTLEESWDVAAEMSLQHWVFHHDGFGLWGDHFDFELLKMARRAYKRCFGKRPPKSLKGVQREEAAYEAKRHEEHDKQILGCSLCWNDQEKAEQAPVEPLRIGAGSDSSNISNREEQEMRHERGKNGSSICDVVER